MEKVLVCGGGAHNTLLIQRPKALLAPRQADSTKNHGLHPDYVESIAFAWLAKQMLEDLPGNLAAVTGAKRSVVQGGVYLAWTGNARARPGTR
jgi:anhydro-N-acetylmuramic acid kinase